MAKGKEEAGNETRPESLADLPPRKKLPKSLQETLDNEEKLWSALYEGSEVESTDTSVRYAAYAARLRTIMLSAHRYVAYTSDIGESFRPVAHPYLVRGAYGISWAYILGDVSYEGYKAYQHNQLVKNPAGYIESITDSEKKAAALDAVQKINGGSSVLVPGRVAAIDDYRSVMAKRAIFQSIASMGLPAFTIHSIVRYSGRAMKDMKNKTIRTWTPIGLGLAAVPFLPYLFDKPVEEAVEWVFHKGFEAVGGPEAVHAKPLGVVSATGTGKEKEL